MKRFFAILSVLLLCLALCACGKKQAEEPSSQTAESAAAAESQPAAQPRDTRRYHTQEITADNWSTYFELREVPLYTITSQGVIAQVYQNYCVVLRDEYAPYVRADSSESVRFSFSFDLYIDTLDIDTAHYTYRHTDDLFYATSATRTAVFDRNALYNSAYGTNYLDHPGYANAFFSGWATLQTDTKVWAGFYIDLSGVKLVDVSGSIELAD